MRYELTNASAYSNAPWTGADQCCFVSIDDIIIYGINAVEPIYYLRLVSERLIEAGIKIKPNNGKQNSMIYSSESEDSEHSLRCNPIHNIIFSVHLSPRFTRWRPIYDIYVLNFTLFYLIILYFFL